MIEDHFGDLFRIPPLVLPGSNLLIGVRQLAFRLWAYEQDEGPEPGETQCRDWRCVQVSYEEEFATISLKGGPAVYWWDSNCNDYEAAVCYSCSEPAVNHHAFGSRQIESLLVAACLPSLESVNIIFHDDENSEVNLLDSEDNYPWRLLPYPNSDDKHPTGEQKHIFIPASPSFFSRPELDLCPWMQQTPLKSFGYFGGSMTEFFLHYETFRWMHTLM